MNTFFLKKICVVIAIDAKIVHLIYFTAFFKKQIELNGHDELHNELQLVISVMVGLKNVTNARHFPNPLPQPSVTRTPHIMLNMRWNLLSHIDIR